MSSYSTNRSQTRFQSSAPAVIQQTEVLVLRRMRSNRPLIAKTAMNGAQLFKAQGDSVGLMSGPPAKQKATTGPSTPLRAKDALHFAQDDRFLELLTKNKSKSKNKSNHRSFDSAALRSG
jgi:hypothetical protein